MILGPFFSFLILPMLSSIASNFFMSPSGVKLVSICTAALRKYSLSFVPMGSV